MGPAKTLADVEQGVRKVAWNENIVAADSAGHIGYWHPGRYLRRAAGVDQRFPTPGDGSADPSGLLSFEELPHVVDPPAGYVANWNTKPAHGWVDGDLSGTTTRPAGPANRITTVQQLLGTATGLTGADLSRIDTRIGEGDMRASGYGPVWRALQAAGGLTAQEKAALDLLVGWDGRAYAPGEPGGSSALGTPAPQVTDGPAATLFAAVVPRVKQQLFASLPADVRSRLDTLPAESHQYDVSPLDNSALRTLRPGFSGLTPSRDWTGGRGRLAVTRAALDAALRDLTSAYGSDPASWRRPHALSQLNSLSGVVGPSTTMPFEDRGSWVQHIAFTTGVPQPGTGQVR